MNRSNNARAPSPGIIKIIGIGQRLRGDDAAGLEAVRLWQETCLINDERPNVHVELAELPGIGLLSLLVDSRVAILVDAVHSQAKPGEVYVLNEDQLEAFSEGSGSAHGWGVAETLLLGRQLNPSTLPEKLILIGIEAGELRPGEALSPDVRSALPEVVRLIEQFVVNEVLPK